METKKFWICEIDRMGQRTGNYNAAEIPTRFVIKRGGFYYLGIDNVHDTGYIEPAGTCFLYTSEEQAQRAALS